MSNNKEGASKEELIKDLMNRFDPFKSTIEELPEEKIQELAILNSGTYYTIRVGGKDTHYLFEGLETAMRWANSIAINNLKERGIQYFHEWQKGKDEGNYTKRAKGKSNTHSFSIHLIYLGHPEYMKESSPVLGGLDLSELDVAAPITEADPIEQNEVKAFMDKHYIVYNEEFDSLMYVGTRGGFSDIMVEEDTPWDTMEGIRYYYQKMKEKKLHIKSLEEQERIENAKAREEDKYQ